MIKQNSIKTSKKSIYVLLNLMNKCRFCAVIVFILFLSLDSFTVSAVNISGIIRDAKTGEAIPFANLIVKNTTNGIMSGLNGSFSLEIEKIPCVLIVKFIGYTSKEINIQNQKSSLNILLHKDVYSLDELTVKPDNKYLKLLLKKIIQNRKINNPDNINDLSYQDYTRTTVFLSNLGLKTLRSATFNKSADAFVKSSDSTLMMPFFIDEILTSNYRTNKSTKSKMLASKSDGILPLVNTQIKSVLNNKIVSGFNFYDNQISILSRGFPSPISSTSLLYYNVYLSDSTVCKNSKRYKFNFFPKNYKNITFKGYFWVDSDTWALTEIKAELPNSANLNFIKDLNVHIKYELLDEKKWFYKSQKINLKFSYSKKDGKKTKNKSFDIQKLMYYRDADIRGEGVGGVDSESGLEIQDINSANQEILLIRNEFAPLDSFEESAYNGINKLKENKFIKIADKFSAMTLSSYYSMGKLDLGPYFFFYRKNEIEGNRFTLPLRTNEKLFKNVMFAAYIGYGNKNKKMAFGGNIKYLLPQTKRTILSANYHYDYFDLTRNKFVEFIRENPYSQGGGNIVSSFTSKIPNPYMMKNKHIDITYEHQLSNSLGLLIRSSLNRYYSNYNLLFAKAGKNISCFDTKNLLVDLRLSFDQDYDQGYFSRIYYGNEKPVFHFTSLLGKYTFPVGKTLTSGYYVNLNLSMKNRINIGTMYLKTMIEGGTILGNVPYPLLQLPRGTRDIGSARYHFNLLHHSSFASDVYLSTHMSLNGAGVIFNKIPLVKNFNLREIVSFKAYYGRLMGNHDKVMSVPDMLQAPTKQPYMEMGFGVTNIFKCLRIEYVRRINKAELFNKFSTKHGIRFRLELSF